MNTKAIIQKYKELVEHLEAYYDAQNSPAVKLIHPQWENHLKALEKELSLLQEQEKESSVNFMQIRELTDEEWMKLPKEEILQLYKNCYAMLQNYVKLSGEKIPQVQTVTSTDYKVDQSDIREELIRFLRDNHVRCVYGLVPEEKLVDEYLKAKER